MLLKRVIIHSILFQAYLWHFAIHYSFFSLSFVTYMTARRKADRPLASSARCNKKNGIFLKL